MLANQIGPSMCINRYMYIYVYFIFSLVLRAARWGGAYRGKELIPSCYSQPCPKTMPLPKAGEQVCTACDLRKSLK